VNWDLIIQSLVVAVITAIATGFVNGKVMEARLDSLKEKIIDLEGEVKTMRQRLHDLGNRVSEVITLGRWIEEDRRKL
jgi:hypothetical protein